MGFGIIEVVVVSLFFILMDVATGVCKAAYKRELSSSKMREGLWHKAGEAFLLLLGIAAQYAVDYAGVPADIPSAVFNTIAVYIIGMELVSILENISELNPELKLAKIMQLFGKNKESEE